MPVQLRVVEFDENVDGDKKSLVGDDHLHLYSVNHLVLARLNESPQVIIMFIRYKGWHHAVHLVPRRLS